MGRLQKSLPQFNKYGASLYAISVDSPARQKKLKKRVGVSFPILSDAKLTIIRRFGAEHKGSDIARPAVFLLNSKGEVVWSKVGRHTRDRPAESVVLEQAKALHQASQTSKPTSKPTPKR
ncbi:MAG: redoxin domain-containing protein [Deltaproteobacteria bacterium]|nr:MAG: redoxin domain-containing protein [Deltaproteobacteria bacterium]